MSAKGNPYDYKDYVDSYCGTCRIVTARLVNMGNPTRRYYDDTGKSLDSRGKSIASTLQMITVVISGVSRCSRLISINCNLEPYNEYKQWKEETERSCLVEWESNSCGGNLRQCIE